jgi:hypothetical protein
MSDCPDGLRFENYRLEMRVLTLEAQTQNMASIVMVAVRDARARGDEDLAVRLEVGLQLATGDRVAEAIASFPSPGSSRH